MSEISRVVRSRSSPCLTSATRIRRNTRCRSAANGRSARSATLVIRRGMPARSFCSSQKRRRAMAEGIALSPRVGAPRDLSRTPMPGISAGKRRPTSVIATTRVDWSSSPFERPSGSPTSFIFRSTHRSRSRRHRPRVPLGEVVGSGLRRSSGPSSSSSSSPFCVLSREVAAGVADAGACLFRFSSAEAVVAAGGVVEAVAGEEAASVDSGAVEGSVVAAVAQAGRIRRARET